MSAIEIRSLSSAPLEPWRNGGGVTQALAARPNAWRISLAQVERDGPYSRFDGVTRTSFVLRGNGVTLDDGSSLVKLAPFAAAEYDGGAAWNACLADGPVTVLNVMSAAGRYRVKIDAIDAPISVAPGCTAIVIALDSGCRYRGACDSEQMGALAPAGFMLVNEVDRPLFLQPDTSASLAPSAAAARQGAGPCVLVTLEPAIAGAID
jgi:hypothetical protein